MTAFDIVKKLSEEQKISIVELEEKLEFSRNSLYSWKINNPSSEKLEKVADYFNVSTDYLLGRTAFRKPMDLFDHWNGSNNPHFESPFDFGGLLKEAREEQGIQQKEVSEALNITELDVNDIENGILPLNSAWAEKYANFLGKTVEEIFRDNGMDASLDDIPLELLHHYQEKGMSEDEIAKAYGEHVKANMEDAMKDDDTISAHHNGGLFDDTPGYALGKETPESIKAWLRTGDLTDEEKASLSEEMEDYFLARKQRIINSRHKGGK